MQKHQVKNCNVKVKTVISIAAYSVSACVLLISLLTPVTAYAETTDLKQGAAQAGEAVGSAVHKIGQTGKEVGLGIAHEAVDVGHAARTGAIQFWHAVTGNKMENKPTVTESTKSQH